MTQPPAKRAKESAPMTEECALCGATLTKDEFEDTVTMGLVCTECIENNEWTEDELP